jgi:LAO/AO transport system kinase
MVCSCHERPAGCGSALRVLDAAGCDVVLVETVGVGQSEVEVEVVSLADSTLVLLAPAMGDGVQVAKAGILEVADIFVVNKADRDGAEQTVRDLKYMISLGRRDVSGPSWRPPIVKTVASRCEGIDDVVTAIEEHHSWMSAHGELEQRRQRRAEAEVEAIAVEQLRERLGDIRDKHSGSALPGLAKQVAAGKLDRYVAADELVAALSRNGQEGPSN